MKNYLLYMRKSLGTEFLSCRCVSAASQSRQQNFMNTRGDFNAEISFTPVLLSQTSSVTLPCSLVVRVCNAEFTGLDAST